MATVNTVRSQKRLLRPLNVSAPVPPSLRGNPLLASLGKVTVTTRPVAVTLPSPTMRRRHPSLSGTREALDVLIGRQSNSPLDQTQTATAAHQTLFSSWLDRQETVRSAALPASNPSTPSTQSPNLSSSNTPSTPKVTGKRGHRRNASTISISFKPDPIPSMPNLSSSRLSSHGQDPTSNPRIHHVRRPSLSLAFSPPSFH